LLFIGALKLALSSCILIEMHQYGEAPFISRSSSKSRLDAIFDDDQCGAGSIILK
jgi:hypothetical protein